MLSYNPKLATLGISPNLLGLMAPDVVTSGQPVHRDRLRRLGSVMMAFALTELLTACTGFIPTSGPARQDIFNSTEIRVQNGDPQARLGFALVRVDARVTGQLVSQDVVARFSRLMTDVQPPVIRVGIGDVLNVTIFETGSGGLFIPPDAGARPGNYVQIPPQQVGQDGFITVPYAGKIGAAGRTPIEIQNTIEARLQQRALEPQVIVGFAERHANDISVLGEVTTATRFSMDGSGEHVLGAIARAAGPKYPAYETQVTLQRHGRAETALLSEIAADPTQNVSLTAGDVVYVAHEPRYFLAVGATGQTTTLSQLDRRFPFGDSQLTLSDALAKAGGLQDDRADALGVFLYRTETHQTLEKLGLNVPASMPQDVPTIYAVDLSKADGLFFCNQLWMRNGDTVFVSNAPQVDLLKVLNLVLPLTESANFARATTR
jgi:polysaccharide export outer membrane protein